MSDVVKKLRWIETGAGVETASTEFGDYVISETRRVREDMIPALELTLAGGLFYSWYLDRSEARLRAQQDYDRRRLEGSAVVRDLPPNLEWQKRIDDLSARLVVEMAKVIDLEKKIRLLEEQHESERRVLTSVVEILGEKIAELRSRS